MNKTGEPCAGLQLTESEIVQMFGLWVAAGCRPPEAPMTEAEIEAAWRVIDVRLAATSPRNEP